VEDKVAPLNAYLDNAASTRLDERVLEAMKPLFFETYAVATSEFGYSMGIEAREALERARASLCERLGGAAEEFVFTSGSTESSNMALKGVAMALGEKKGRHIITLRIEDFPVLNTAASLGKYGYRVTLLEVDAAREPGDRHGSGHRSDREDLPGEGCPLSHPCGTSSGWPSSS
jgi:cysteine desulfurase